jgi:hypothetical protein
MEVAQTMNTYDVSVNASGGGVMGQAGAVRLAIARALTETNPELRGPLKAEGFLTRDPRMKERKKAGQPGARKRFSSPSAKPASQNFLLEARAARPPGCAQRGFLCLPRRVLPRQRMTCRSTSARKRIGRADIPGPPRFYQCPCRLG